MAGKLMLAAGEVSGDMYGGRLARAVLEMAPGIELSGIGGDSMAEAGVKLFAHISDLSVMGIWEVIRDVRRLRRILGKAKQNLRDTRPDGLILIDFYRFNIELAKEAGRLGIPVVYYVAPKLWGWGQSRIKHLKQHVDHILAIFPFEEEYFRSRGMPVFYVGNPLTEILEDREPAGSQKLTRHPGEMVISLLPGSRINEVRYLLPSFLVAAKLIAREQDEKVKYYLPLPRTVLKENIAEIINSEDVDITIVEGRSMEVLALSDVALVASGTATLEAFLLGIPQVVAYRTSWLTYFLGKHFVKIDHFSLPNILAGRAVVEEFLQDDVIPERLAQAALRLLEDDSQARKEYLHAGKEVLEALRGKEASRLAAAKALQIISGEST